MSSKKIIVALTGASGIDYGIETLKALAGTNTETHLIVSKWAEKVIQMESKYSLEEVKQIAAKVYTDTEMDAPISSGSTLINGMVVIPATVKTVSNIANANTGNLTARTADIMLKMKKPLIIGIRETPLSPACIHNMYKLSTYGAIVLPLSPGFYHKPKQIQDLYDFISGKVLDCLDIPNKKYKRWNESKLTE
ncbi:MAG: UbiX family flavin prenyltransferase [Candidatus Hodarchaeales archaeon]